MKDRKRPLDPRWRVEAQKRAVRRAEVLADPAAYARLRQRVKEKLKVMREAEDATSEFPSPPQAVEGTPHWDVQEVARRYLYRARKSLDAVDAGIAQILNAAWLAETRRQRGTPQDRAQDQQFAALAAAAEDYLSTVNISSLGAERLAEDEVPRVHGKRRTAAVRELIFGAGFELECFKSAPYGGRVRQWNAHEVHFMAVLLFRSAVALGFHAVANAEEDRVSVDDLTLANVKASESIEWLGAKIFDSPAAPDHQVASWTLQACGVSSKDADNWIGSAIRSKKTSDS